jgi:hypothetical protein
MARDFKRLRESAVKTADKKPEKYTKPDGKVGIRMVPVDKQIVKNEDKDLDELSMTAIKKGVTGSGMKNVAKAMGKDKLKKDLEDMKAKMATEAYDEPQGQAKRMMSPLQKARMDKEKADRDSEGKLKRGRSTLSRLRDIQNKSNAMAAKPRKEEVELDEVLDRPGALASYKKKAKMQSDKARNSATAKIVRGNSDISKEKETIRKREKGQDMADRTGARQFRKSIGRPYIKKEQVELDEISKDLAGRYMKKAKSDAEKAGSEVEREIQTRGYGSAAKPMARQMKRLKGINQAKKRMSEEVEQLDELSPRTKASYLKKASAQNKKVQKAYDKSVKSSPDAYFGFDSPEDQKRAKTMDKRQKGIAMAKGRKYGQKYESVEYVNEKLKVSDGMGAWVDDFKKSDAPQFKGKSDKERREMAIAAYLSAKRGDKK